MCDTKKTDYANRYSEFLNIERSFQTGRKVVFLIAGHAYGITSFLKTFCERLNSTTTETFFISAVSGKNFAELLLEALIRTPHLHDLQKMADSAYGSRSDAILSSVAKAIPYAGELIANLIGGKQAAPIYTGYYSSIIEELLSTFFNKHLKKKDIIVAIDHAQNINEESYIQLVNLLLHSHVKIIFAITDIGEAFLKLENYISNHETIKYDKVIFDQPQIKLVKELGNFFGYCIGEDVYSTV